jgi:hypothetical protein
VFRRQRAEKEPDNSADQRGLPQGVTERSNQRFAELCDGVWHDCGPKNAIQASGWASALRAIDFATVIEIRKTERLNKMA